MDKPIKFLLVEDEAVIAQCLKMELEQAGYEVCKCVAKGVEAIKLAKEETPDIILMDIHISGKMDGIETASKIKEQNDVPIIFMTGYNETTFIKRANAVNPTAYLEKPVEVYDLEQIIKQIV